MALVTGFAVAKAQILTLPNQTSSGQIQLSLNGNTGNYYTVEFSTNLIDWISILTTNLPNGPSLSLNLPMTNQLGFYQAYESAIAVDQSIFQFGTGVAGMPVIYVNVADGVATITICPPLKPTTHQPK
jgi:hypothetical protein